MITIITRLQSRPNLPPSLDMLMAVQISTRLSRALLKWLDLVWIWSKRSRDSYLSQEAVVPILQLRLWCVRIARRRGDMVCPCFLRPRLSTTPHLSMLISTLPESTEPCLCKISNNCQPLSSLPGPRRNSDRGMAQLWAAGVTDLWVSPVRGALRWDLRPRKAWEKVINILRSLRWQKPTNL